MNCLSLIRQRYPSMSPVERRIADCILADPEKAMNSTVVYIAATAKVSEGSVINFSNMLGFKGFSQLKISLAQNISTFNAKDEFVKSDTPKQVMRKMISQAVTSFESTYDTIGEQLDQAVESVLAANKILVVGVGHSKIIAMDIAIRMMWIGLNAIAEPDPTLAGITAAQLHDNDVLIVVSNSGRTREVISTARVARNVGAKVIVLTSHPGSPLEKMSDISLLSVSTETHTYKEPTTARLTQLLLGDSLVETIMMHLGDDAVIRMDKMIELYSQHREAVSLGG